MNDIEIDRWLKFQQKHKNCKKKFKKRIELYCKTYSTGIGTVYIAICDNCKTIYNITDYSCW